MRKRIVKIFLAIVAILIIICVALALAEEKAIASASDNASVAKISDNATNAHFMVVGVTSEGNYINYNFRQKVKIKDAAIGSYRGAEKKIPAMIKKILAVKGVESVSVYNYKIVVEKGESFSMSEVKPNALPIIQRGLGFSEDVCYVIDNDELAREREKIYYNENAGHKGAKPRIKAYYKNTLTGEEKEDRIQERQTRREEQIKNCPHCQHMKSNNHPW